LLEKTTNRPRLMVLNKIDLASDSSRAAAVIGVQRALDSAEVDRNPIVPVSAATARGLDGLRREIARALTGRESLREIASISNTRHIALLERARVSLAGARQAALDDAPEEFVLSDLQSARQSFDEMVGHRTTDDLLAHIFERFCIGK